jgi:hypothetical protein
MDDVAAPTLDRRVDPGGDPTDTYLCRLPPVVHRLADIDVPVPLLHDLALRRALLDGRTSTMQLAEAMKLSPTLMEALVEQLRDLRYLEIHGREGRNLLVTLSEPGRLQATERMQHQRYAGAVPVSLAAYTAVVRAQDAEPDIRRDQMRRAFADLVISDELLDELGPAARAKGAIFLYGPPGTGKSAIAERLIRVHADEVLIPHAVEVDGQVILVFDPVVHKPVAEQPPGMDERWVLCRRPCIIVGGELTMSELDLTFEQASGVYLAPRQMQANNGILVIDDLGRQQITPEQLLNRWIVPLDRRVDYLSLSYGMKFEVPCAAKIVFSTNLDPAALGDEAFFRRIRSKVLIPGMTDGQFDDVLRRVSIAHGVAVSAGAPSHLRWLSRNRGDGDLRPYLPVAVCELVESVCGYEDVPMRLDRAMVDRVTDLYFAQAEATGSTLGEVAVPPEPPSDADETRDAWPLPSRLVAVADELEFDLDLDLDLDEPRPDSADRPMEAEAEAVVEPACEPDDPRWPSLELANATSF